MSWAKFKAWWKSFAHVKIVHVGMSCAPLEITSYKEAELRLTVEREFPYHLGRQMSGDFIEAYFKRMRMENEDEIRRALPLQFHHEVDPVRGKYVTTAVCFIPAKME